MNLSWKRVVMLAAALAIALACALSPIAAQAAKNTDPCKSNAKSSACKASKAKAAARTKTTKAKADTTTARKPSKVSSAKSKSQASAKHATRVVTRIKTVQGKRTMVTRRAAPAAIPQAAIAAGLPQSADTSALRSSVAYVQDLETSNVLFAKNANAVRPIASITKLMTALVVIDANQPLDAMLEITQDDVDRVRHAPSRLTVGTRLTRADMLHLALMSSENRAAHALGRNYPGGIEAFARAMNVKARSLGMYDSYFVEPTGLSSSNVSSPRDLVRMIRAASQRPLIHRYTTDTQYEIETRSGRVETYRNTNALVRNSDWDIKLSKTGFINEAGECLVMLTRINGRDVAIVLLNSQGKYSRIGDAVRLRRLMQNEIAML